MGGTASHSITMPRGSQHVILSGDEAGFVPPFPGLYVNRWNTMMDDSGTRYSVNQTIILTSNLRLYAQWDFL
jgi:hypothetical protein